MFTIDSHTCSLEEIEGKSKKLIDREIATIQRGDGTMDKNGKFKIIQNFVSGLCRGQNFFTCGPINRIAERSAVVRHNTHNEMNGEYYIMTSEWMISKRRNRRQRKVRKIIKKRRQHKHNRLSPKSCAMFGRLQQATWTVCVCVCYDVLIGILPFYQHMTNILIC